MARYNPFKGMSVSELAEMNPEEYNSLNARERAYLVTKLASAANKRMRRMIEAGVETPLSRRVLERGPFSAKGKSGVDLKQEALEVMSFLREPEQSTVRGAKKWWRDILREYEVDTETGEMFLRDTDAMDTVSRIFNEYKDRCAQMGISYEDFLELIQEEVLGAAGDTGLVNFQRHMEIWEHEVRAMIDNRRKEAENYDWVDVSGQGGYVDGAGVGFRDYSDFLNMW